MKKLTMLFIAFITLMGCGGDHQQEENTSEWGDSIATINNTAYYERAALCGEKGVPL